MQHLQNEADSTLASMVKESNDENALVELISRHSGIYVSMVSRFGKKSLSPFQIQDILDDKDLMIYKAALDYDEVKSKFSTYLANRARYVCLTQKTQNKRNTRFVSIENVEFSLKEESRNPSDSCSFNDSFEGLIDKLLSHSDKRVKTIFYERYFNGEKGKLKPWKQVALEVNLSTQGCINVHDKALDEIKHEVEDEIKQESEDEIKF